MFLFRKKSNINNQKGKKKILNKILGLTDLQCVTNDEEKCKDLADSCS